MAKQVKLAAQTRSEVGRAAVKKIKSQGFVPAVIYSKSESPVSLKVVEREISNILAHAAGEHFLVDLNVEGSATGQMAIIQEVQHHPVTQKILHIDFHGVSANEEVESSIPLEPVGDAVGVKSYGGILEQLVRSIKIKSLPKDLPELITVDVSNLNVGESIHIKDIVLPAGVRALDDADVTAFLIAAPKVSAAATEEKK
jgi:large subunit ribosomal protein L25